MALLIDGIIFDELTSDPGTPVDGQAWYNTTENRLKLRRNGTTEILIDKTEFDAHANGTSNPHTVTLEQARTGGATLAGDINMGGNKITNVVPDSAPSSVATLQTVDDKITARVAELDAQESVLDKDLVTAPGSPTLADRYIIAGIGGGWSGGTINDIAEWDGSAWVFTTPNLGMRTFVEDEGRKYEWTGSAWNFFEETHDHGQLIGLGDDDHTQYLLAGGSRAMSGNLDMGTNAITNVGLVDGVDVSGHQARHLSSGADEIDGDKLDIDWNPTNYTPDTAPTEVTSVDELTAHLAGIDTLLGTISGGQLEHKAGEVLAAGFTGNPKKSTVTLGTAFSDSDYSVSVIAETTGNKTFSPAIDSAKAAGSFVINLGSNSLTGLVKVLWTATKHGEE